MEIIFCAAKNRRFAEIALACGFKYGARLPDPVYFAPYFVDQEWANPDRTAYVAAVRQHRPYMASVLDWERAEQLPEVLGWAEEIAPFIEEVILVPKVVDGIARLPRRVGGKPVRLGYSVPTRHGATPVPVWEFAGWPVHLLGGDPRRQMALARILDVRSADGNKWMLQARNNQVWVPQVLLVGRARNRQWPQLQEIGLGHLDQDSVYAAFRLSSENIQRTWQTGQITVQLPLV